MIPQLRLERSRQRQRMGGGLQRQISPDLMARGGLLVLLMLFFTLLNPIITGNKPDPYTGAGNTFRQISYTGLFLAIILWSGALRNPRNAFVLPWTMLLALGWCWASLFWALEPSIAFRRLALTTNLILSIFVVVQLAGYSRTVDVMRVMLFLTLVANFVTVIAFPRVGIHQAGEPGMAAADLGLIGDWRGVLPQKNFTGAFCAFTIMMFVFDSRKIGGVTKAAVVIGSAYFLYRTHSKTSAGILCLSLLVGALFARYDRKYRGLVLPLVVILAAVIVYVSYFYGEAITAPFHRADALTGRVQIWPALLDYSKDHPLLGTGYGSFWNIGGDSPIYRYGQHWVIDVVQGHDGYLDMLVQIGVPGLALVIIAVFVAPAAKLLTSTHIIGQQRALLAAMLFFCICHNFTESSVFNRDEIVEIFLMFTLGLIAQLCRSPDDLARSPRARLMAGRRPAVTARVV